MIPNNIFAEEVATAKYPPWVHQNKAYSSNGLFQEYVVYKIFQNIAGKIKGTPFDEFLQHEEIIATLPMETLLSISDVNNKDINWRSCLNQCYKVAFNDGKGDIPEFKAAYFGKLDTLLRKYFLNLTCEFGKEIGEGIIKGHPDIYIPDFMGEGLILDVKTCEKFYTMKQNTIKQLLAYVALMRENHPESHSRYIGVILPLQKQILLYDLKGWDHKGYLQELFNYLQILPMDREIEGIIAFTTMGSHFAKKRTLIDSITTYYQECNDYGIPMQMFLRSPRGNGKNHKHCDDDDEIEVEKPYKKLIYTQKDIDQTRTFITSHNIKYFTHAPYFINLSKPYPGALNILIDDLQITNSIAGSGVVVHVGKSLTMDEDTATANMIISIRKVLPYATENCPLIIETPAGQGTELLSRFSSFIAFWNSFTSEEKQKMALCMDTCHVFACGYYPSDYLQSMGENIGFNNIRLVHMNDSLKDLNCRVDNHSPIGKGCIGFQMLSETARICNQYSIPMVSE